MQSGKYTEITIKIPTQYELLQKYKGKEKTVDMDRSLWRAAALGNKEDVKYLLKYGAQVNSVAPDGKTALHWAMEKENIPIIKLLLNHGALLYKKDNNDITPAIIASNSNNESIRAYSMNLVNPFLQIQSHLILHFLTLKDLMAMKKVCVTLAFNVIAYEEEFYKQLPVGSKVTIQKLSMPLKNVVFDRMFDQKNLPQLCDLLTLLQTTPDNRIMSFNQKFEEKITDPHFKLTDAAVISLIFGITTAKELKDKSKLNNEFAIYAIDQKLIPVGHKMFAGTSYYTSAHHPLLCENGIKALKGGLINLNQVSEYNDSNLNQLLTDNGMKLLAGNLISHKVIIAMIKSYSFNVATITHPTIIKLLEKGTINFSNLNSENKEDIEMAISICSNYEILVEPSCQELFNLIPVKNLVKIKGLKSVHIPFLKEIITDKLIPVEEIGNIKGIINLLCPLGVTALSQGFITWRQAKEFDNLSYLITENGLKCLKSGIFSVRDALEISKVKSGSSYNDNADNLKYLSSDEGQFALIEQAITLDDAKKYYLSVLLIPGAITALKEKLITLAQISKFHEYGACFQARSLTALFTEPGLQALREKLITPEQASKFFHSGSCHGPHDNLAKLLNPIGMAALRKKLIDPDKATCISLELLLNEENPDIITAMELGLIMSSDIQYYSKSPSWKYCTSPCETKKLIAEHLENNFNNNDTVKKVTFIQNQCRSYNAKNKLMFFQTIDNQLKSGEVSLKSLHAINEALSLADKGKLAEANERISLK